MPSIKKILPSWMIGMIWCWIVEDVLNTTSSRQQSTVNAVISLVIQLCQYTDTWHAGTKSNIYYIEPYKQTGTLRLEYIYWYLDIHNLDISNNIYVCSGCVLVLACWLTVVAGDGYGHGHSSHGIGTACIVKVDTYIYWYRHISTHFYSYIYRSGELLPVPLLQVWEGTHSL